MTEPLRDAPSTAFIIGTMKAGAPGTAKSPILFAALGDGSDKPPLKQMAFTRTKRFLIDKPLSDEFLDLFIGLVLDPAIDAPACPFGIAKEGRPDRPPVPTGLFFPLFQRIAMGRRANPATVPRILLVVHM